MKELEAILWPTASLCIMWSVCTLVLRGLLGRFLAFRLPVAKYRASVFVPQSFKIPSELICGAESNPPREEV